MNDKILQLLVQSGLLMNVSEYRVSELDPNIKKFAELIVKECKENFAKIWYEQGVDCRGAELGKLLTRFDEHFGVEE